MLKQGWSKFKRKCKSPKDCLRKALDFIFSEIIWDSIFKVFLKLLWAFKGIAKGLKRLIDSIFSRVSGGHHCPQLPSEPYVTVSHHTAQAFCLSDFSPFNIGKV
ncbi:hypothetical protein OCF64_27845, partial [Bacillus wiedmannii]|uniref:hypothetical protein n=1 Tax=Bacillus wiedmannii TaxID=1890302 RepID=UPI0021D23C3F